MTIALYLFDIDGTLLLSGGAGKRALEAVFLRRYGVAGAMQGIRPNGRTDPWIIGEMFHSCGRSCDDAEIARVLDEYERTLGDEIAASPTFRLMPGAHEMVSFLHTRRALLGLATGNTEHGARIKLERADLWRYFAEPGGRAIGGFGSDSADRVALVRTALSRAETRLGHSIAAGDVLLIGDTPHDIGAARAVGMQVAAVATGGHTVEELLDAGAHAAFATLVDLLPRMRPGGDWS